MEWIRTFFEETPAVASAMRLIYIIGCIWLMLFTTLCVFTHKATFVEAMNAFVQNFSVLQILKTAHKHIETRGKV